MLKTITSFFSALLLSVFSLFALYTPSVSAAVVEWDGGGAGNNLSTAENWVGDVAPVDGDSLVFPAAAVDADNCETPPTQLINDYDPATTTFAGISFTNITIASFCEDAAEGNDSGVRLTGNNLSLSGDLATEQIGNSKLSVEVDVEAVSNMNLVNIIAPSMVVTINSFDVALQSSTVDSVVGDGALTIEYSPDHTSGKGGGGPCGEHSGSSPVGGDSSGFSGSLLLSANLRSTSQQGDLASQASGITVQGATITFGLDYNETREFSVPVIFSGGSLFANQTGNADCDFGDNAKITFTGAVTATTDVVVSPRNMANIVFAGDVTGKNFFTVADGVTNPGTVQFPDGETKSSDLKEVVIDDVADCFNGELWNSNAKSIFTVDCSGELGTNSEFPRQIFGIIGGTGKVGHIQLMDGSIIAPGLSPGILTVSSLTMDEGSTYEFELAGTEPGDEYDQIVAEESVTIDNATLDVVFLDGFTPEQDDSFVIILNQGNDPVDGTFTGLEEGAELAVGDVTFSITYEGGEGENDVVLTVVDAPEADAPDAPDTGFALITASPLMSFLVAIVSAGGLAIFARRHLQTS